MTSVVTALLFFSRASAAEDWPVVRGDTQGTGVAKSAVSDELDVVWTCQAGDDAGFDATPVVGGGTIYIGDSAGKMHAVKLDDGTAVWTKEFPDSGFGAGAAIDKDRLFVGDLNGTVRSLSISDGSELWSANLEGEVYAGPTPHDESVLVTCERGTLACYGAKDGKERWPQFRIDSPLRCSPTILSGRAMVSGCDSLLHVIDVEDGKELHTLEIDGPTGSTPAMLGERVYFGTESGTFYAIDVPVDKPPTIAWTFKDPRRGQSIRSAAAVSKDLVTFGSQGKMIYGLDPSSGDVKWKVPTRSRIESSPVIAGERVIAATAAGKLYLLDADTGDVKWEYDAGGGFVGSPAVVDGRIILGNTDGTLYCFGSKAEGSTTEGTENTETNK